MTQPPSKPTNPHDRLFKRTFSVLDNASAQLRAVLPAPVVAEIDFKTLEVVSGTFVDDLYSETHSDLLYKVKLRGKDGLIYTVFEHQSSDDGLMPLRLLGYVVRVLDQYVRDHGKRPPLPPVVSVVLHHSEAGWSGALTLLDLFDPELLAIDGLRELLPNMRLILDDISHASDETLMARAANELALAVPVVLWAMRDARDAGQLMTSLARFASFLQKVWTSPGGRDVLIEVFRYISAVGAIERDELIEVAAAAGQEAKEIAVTLAEKLRAEGREEGRAEGRAETERDVLTKLLRKQFGELSPSALDRIAAAGEPQLSQWLELAWEAKSLDEVLS